MQDYPKALPQGSQVGFTTINQVWASYSPVKNSPADALAKFKDGNPTHSATSGEMDIYRCNCLTLKTLTGAELPEEVSLVAYNGIEVEDYPKVVLSPSFAPLLKDLQDKIAFGSIKLAPGAVLVLDGPDITVKGPLAVDGALVVRSVPGAKVSIGRLDVKNAGWEWRALEEGQGDATEEERIRGFRVIQKETKLYEFKQPGVCAIASPLMYKPS
jgi:UDP-sugar pyrophosphorylase